MTNSNIRDHAERLIRLHEACEAAKEDLAQGYQDAADDGFTKSALRAAIKIHRLDANKRARHDAQQMDLELYLENLEGTREAAQ